MASVQDRNNIYRVALDKWTKREQLCLASAVSCSGDQNWMTVSRSLKLLCGAHHPPDWFSQKLCAVKYGELLENVETPKRKKRTTSDNASNIVETPTDSILRRLTEERIQELKSEIREQQETYAKLYTDVVHLQTGNSNEEQIRAMWMEIEREQELDRQLKARKQIGSHDIQKNWRQVQFQQQKQQMPISQLQQEQDMEIDDTCKPQGTSPLLSSLLKSTSPPSQVGTTMTTSTSRTNAPTITNLLTGGAISSSVSSPTSCTSQPSSLLPQIPLTTPIFGPAPDESSSVPSQTVLSPSQSAPTLSMLLEKNKTVKESPPQPQASSSQQMEKKIETDSTTETNVDPSTVVKNEEDVTMLDAQIEDGAHTPTKEEEQQLMEVFKNLMPDNIDELADILTSNTGILEEDSILLHSMEGVESLMDEAQDVDEKAEANMNQNETKPDSKNPPPMEEDSGTIKVEELAEVDSKELLSINKTETSTEIPVDIKKEEMSSGTVDEKIKSELEVKIETISSDDSSDNVPLAAHAKDAKAASAGSVGTETEESSIAPKHSPMLPDDADSRSGQENIDSTKDDVPLDDDVERKNDLSTSDTRKASSDSSDVIIIPTDDESNDGKPEQQTKESPDNSDTSIKNDEESKLVEPLSQNTIETATNESPFSQEQTITSICLADTDDDSSTFETPTVAPISKDDKSNPPKQPPIYKKQESDGRHEEEVKQTLAVRKLRDRDRSESPLVDDDNSDHSITIRPRRRYSSTQVDSIPNSPASSDDREFKVWKKSLMTVYNNLLTNKNASIFLRPFTDEQNPQYKHVCNRPIDLQIIKRHIENGTIRNVTDFQRDVFLMCNNAMMVFKRNSTYSNMARELMHDFIQLKDQILDAKMEKDKALSSSSPYAHGVKVRGSARKSQRLP